MARPRSVHLMSTSATGGVLADERLDRVLHRAWSELVPRSDEIADAIADAIVDNDRAWYESAPEEVLADVRRSTRDHVRIGILEMAGRPDPERRSTDVWRQTGRRRARQGVPLELVLNAYTLGSRVLWEALLEVGPRPDIGLDDYGLAVAGQRLWQALHLQNSVLIDAHRRESARLVRRDLQRQNRYLDGLIEGRGADPDFAAEASDVLGVRSDEPLACVAAVVDESLDEPLRGAEDRLERAGRTSAWYVRGGVQVGLVPVGGMACARLIDLLRPAASGRVGVARADDGLRGFGAAYSLAVRAAQTLGRGVVDVVNVNDRLPEVLLNASPDITSLLVENSLGALLAQPESHREALLDTLAALIRCNVSHSRAAEQLYCHRNTVIYRQKQIEELTGRDLRVPRDRLHMALALTATGRSIHATPQDS